MLSDLNAIEISSEWESPIWPTSIEEEVMNMSVGSSSIPKKKRQAPAQSHATAEEAHLHFK